MQSPVTSFIFLRDLSNVWIINVTLLFQLYLTGKFRYYDYGSDNMLHYNQVRDSPAPRKKKKYIAMKPLQWLRLDLEN